MQLQSWEILANPRGLGHEELREEFRRLSNNTLANILLSADEDSLNCMKFAHYLPIYDEIFAPLRGSRVNILEIGVQHGGSFKLWQEFFGKDLFVWSGIDIDPRCLNLCSAEDVSRSKVFIGNQSDAAFLSKISEERGPFDIIIDDGSHRSQDIIASFEALSPNVRPGGFYVVEDLHASYWKGFRGKEESANAVTYFQNLVHSLNNGAIDNSRCADDLGEEELVSAPTSIRRIDFHPSMLVCYVDHISPLIEWRSGPKSILSS